MPLAISSGMLLASLLIRVTAGLPALDTKALCSSIGGLGLEKASVMCQRGEEEARGQLEAIWPTVTAPERALCTNSAHLGVSPSYADLLICINIHRDLEALRKDPRSTLSGQEPLTGPSISLTSHDLVQLRLLCRDAGSRLALCARLPPAD